MSNVLMRRACSHATEMTKMRAELDKFRSQSSKLETVEAKIMAVEDALRESKTRATQKEQVSLLLGAIWHSHRAQSETLTERNLT